MTVRSEADHGTSLQQPAPRPDGGNQRGAYIDVMLVLVVILMVAAPFVNPSLINLPSVNKASKAPEKVIEVIVYPDARLSLRSGKTLTPVDMPGSWTASRRCRPIIRKFPSSSPPTRRCATKRSSTS